MEEIDSWVNNYPDKYLWYLAFVFLIGFGLYFTYKLKFQQVTDIKEENKLAFTNMKGSKEKEAISSFEAFCIGLGARIGVGNIAGVAVAIMLGGAGAVFWMWIFAVIGAASSFMECTLAQVFKHRTENGLYVGGPAYYIEKGLKNHSFAILIAVMVFITYGIGFIGVQANNAADAFVGAFDFEGNSYVIAIAIATLTALIIFGGVKRVAKVSHHVVPIMALAWMVIAIATIFWNYTYIWDAVVAVFQGAFNLDAAAGATIGTAIMQGLRRGVFSNEAGIGSVPNVAGTADVKHPAKQGLIQSLGVLIDTLVVCSATAFVILTCNGYASLGSTGSQLVQDVLQQGFLGNIAPVLLAIFMFVFAFSSLIGYYTMCENNVIFLCGERKKPLMAIRIILVLVAFFSCIIPMSLMWDLCDVFMACMGILNMTAVLLLSKYAFRVYKDYKTQKKAGIDEPVFNKNSLEDMDISGIEMWN